MSENKAVVKTTHSNNNERTHVEEVVYCRDDFYGFFANLTFSVKKNSNELRIAGDSPS